MKKRILLLAISSKGGNNYCVAGVDVDNNSFVRLVSDDASIDYAIDKAKFKYTPYEHTPRKLHVIEVNVEKQLPPDGAQTENWLSLINKDVEHVCKYNYLLEEMIPTISVLPYGDTNPFIGDDDYKKLNHSIEVVKAKDVCFSEGINSQGERRIRISFTVGSEIGYARCNDFRLTDPDYIYRDNIFETTIDNAFLVITIGPQDNKYYTNRYKFISGVHPI